jgi:hypothetical protein
VSDEKLKDFLIHRTIDGVANWDEATRKAVAGKSVDVMKQLDAEGVPYEWPGSIVTGPNTLVCHHRARSADDVRRHSKMGGFPLDDVVEGDTLPEGTMKLTSEMAA